MRRSSSTWPFLIGQRDGRDNVARMGTSASNDSFTAPHFASSALLVIDTQVDFLDGAASPIAGTSDRLPEP